MMQSDLDILRDVSTRLEGAGIAFMLTGSVAMNQYAQPRMTRDIDIVVMLNEGDSSTIVDLFEPDYYVPVETELLPADLANDPERMGRFGQEAHQALRGAEQ